MQASLVELCLESPYDIQSRQTAAYRAEQMITRINARGTLLQQEFTIYHTLTLIKVHCSVYSVTSLPVLQLNA